MTTIIAEVRKNSNESTPSLVRRFTKRVQGSGALNKVRGNRYYERAKSKLVVKNSALKVISRRKEIDRLRKLGKLAERPTHGHGRR